MPASSPSKSNRKFLWLAGGIVAVIGIYTAGWYYAANKLEQTVMRVLTPNDARSVEGKCENIDFRGYPFRLGMFCSKVSIADNARGIRAEFGALRSTAAIHSPTHIIWELDSPAQIDNPAGLSVSADWSDLRASLAIKGRGVERSSTVISDLKANLNNGQIALAADRTEIHLRQNGPDLDAAITLRDTTISSPAIPVSLPKFTGVADVTLVGKAGLVDGSEQAGLKNSQGELRRLAADIGNGSTIIISGPFSIDEAGLLSGKLKIEVENLDAWAENARHVAPELGSTIETGRNMLKALSGGGNRASVDLTIRNGTVMLGGLIKVGEIPAL